MPTISMFRGIKVCIYWSDHMPPHFHAFYGGAEVLVRLNAFQATENASGLGGFPSRGAPRELGACKKSAGVVLHRAAEIRRLYHGKHS